MSHHAVYADLRRRIEGGQYAAGLPLPPIAELADEYDTSVTVVRAAQQLLAMHGLVEVSRDRYLAVVARPAVARTRPRTLSLARGRVA